MRLIQNPGTRGNGSVVEVRPASVLLADAGYATPSARQTHPVALLLLPVFLATILSTSCRPHRGAVGLWTMDTLPNGAVLVSNVGQGIWQGRPPWGLVEETRIGTRDGEGPEAFGAIKDIDVDRLGRVYVFDFQAHDVRVFDRQGAYVRSIGRRGRGPGEFSAAQGIRFDPAGRLWVMNQANLRYSLFDTSGTLVREYSRPMFGNLRMGAWYGVFDRSGALYDLVFYRSGTQLTFSDARYDTATGTYVDTLRHVRFPRAPLGWFVRRGTPDGWWAGSAVEYLIYRMTYQGDTLRIIERRDYIPVRLPNAEQGALSEMPAPARERMREQLRRLPVDLQPPDYQPVFRNFIEDDDGYLWVVLSRPPGSAGTPLDVFDPSGRYLGALLTPHPLEKEPEPIVRGGRVYAVVKDELDVPYVVMLRIKGRE